MKRSAFSSTCWRCPSRATWTRVAGPSKRAPSARVRSATTSASNPSGTLARVRLPPRFKASTARVSGTVMNVQVDREVGDTCHPRPEPRRGGGEGDPGAPSRVGLDPLPLRGVYRRAGQRPDPMAPAGDDRRSASVKIPQLAEQRRINVRWSLRLAHDPIEQIPVGHLDQPFERVEFRIRQPGESRIDEAAHQEVHLAGAAMPGAEQDLPPPDVEARAREGRAAHPAAPIAAEDADVALLGYIASPIPDATPTCHVS